MMKPNLLDLAAGVRLPLEVCTRRTAIIAKSGYGKSYTGMKMAELLMDNHCQFVTLDPTGSWRPSPTSNAREARSAPT